MLKEGENECMELEEVKKKINHLEYDEIKNIKDEITNIKVNLAENNLLTKQCINSNEKLNETMISVKDTMITMSESMRQTNKVSEELALSVKSLGNKVDTMDDKFSNKFQEVDDKIKIVDNKTKVDLAETTTNGISSSIIKGIMWLLCGGGLIAIITNFIK